MSTLYARNPITGKFEKVGRGLIPTDQTLSVQGVPADAKAVGDAIQNAKRDILESLPIYKGEVESV